MTTSPEEYDRQYMLDQRAEEEFGPDWEENSLAPERRRFIPENEVSDSSEETDTLHAFQQHFG